MKTAMHELLDWILSGHRSNEEFAAKATELLVKERDQLAQAFKEGTIGGNDYYSNGDEYYSDVFPKTAILIKELKPKNNQSNDLPF